MRGWEGGKERRKKSGARRGSQKGREMVVMRAQRPRGAECSGYLPCVRERGAIEADRWKDEGERRRERKPRLGMDINRRRPRSSAFPQAAVAQAACLL